MVNRLGWDRDFQMIKVVCRDDKEFWGGNEPPLKGSEGRDAQEGRHSSPQDSIHSLIK